MSANQLFLDTFNLLKKDFAAQLPLRLKTIDDALQACREQPGDEARRQDLYRLLHSLGGTAGSFGFVQLGLDAQRIETELAALTQRGSWSEHDIAQIAQALALLKLETPARQP